jgi:hypothetical protein
LFVFCTLTPKIISSVVGQAAVEALLLDQGGFVVGAGRRDTGECDIAGRVQGTETRNRIYINHESV